MAVHVLDGSRPSPLAALVADYLINCRARGLSPRTDEQYSYALESVFLPGAPEGITDLGQLDRRALDRFTSALLARRNRARPSRLQAHRSHTYIRPVRLLLTWAAGKARRSWPSRNSRAASRSATC